MGIDHTTAGSDNNSETVEQKPAADHRPPPPPDRPGTDGFPSRADSRAGAAAANNTDQSTATDKHEQRSGSTDATAESPNGQNFGAKEKDTPAGAQLNESNESPTKDTDAATERTDTSSQQTAERPAAQGAETIDDRDETGRPEAAPNTRDVSSETTVSADRSIAAAEVVRQGENKGLVGGPTEGNSPAKPDTDVTGSPETSRSPATDTARPSPALEVRDGSRDALPDTHLDATPGEAYEAGRPADTPASAVARPEPAIDEHRTTTDHADPGKPPTEAGAAAETGDSQPSSLDAQQPDDTVSKASANYQEGTDALPTDHSQGLSESAGSADGSHQASSGIEQSLEPRAALNVEGDSAEEAGAPREESGEATSPWKYDIRVQDIPLESYLNRTVDENGRTDKGNMLADEQPDVSPVWVEKRSDLPSGEDLLKEQDEDKSRPEKLRRKFFEVVEDVHEITAKAADRGHDIFAHPPTGHAETGTSPEVVPAPNEGVNSGDLATGLLVLGIMFGEGIRHHRKMKQKRGNSHVGDR